MRRFHKISGEGLPQGVVAHARGKSTTVTQARASTATIAAHFDLAPFFVSKFDVSFQKTSQAFVTGTGTQALFA
jgi:hypothetical protein